MFGVENMENVLFVIFLKYVTEKLKNEYATYRPTFHTVLNGYYHAQIT